jgi:hypothetical protein
MVVENRLHSPILKLKGILWDSMYPKLHSSGIQFKKNGKYMQKLVHNKTSYM